MNRELNIHPTVAAQLPASQIAHLQTYAGDSDNPCPFCGHPVLDPVAEVVLLREGPLTVAALAHSACKTTGIYETPGIVAAYEQLAAAAQDPADDDFDILTALAVRPHGEPQAVFLIEPLITVSIDGGDGLELYASTLGLSPILAPDLASIDAPLLSHTRLRVGADTVQVVHPGGVETAIADPEVLRWWVPAADAHAGHALLLIGRGLHLNRHADLSPKEIADQVDEAIRTQPVWAGVTRISTFRRDLYPKRQPARRRLWPFDVRRH